jgi:diadenosine tetraphosphate (Ap4A) HIT family hydrolase
MAWWPDAQWRGMLAGEGCPMCADAHLQSNPASELVAELPTSYARLAKNQTHPGYCVVILKRHATELHELPADELAAFWADVAAVGAAISKTFNPVKLNYLVMGSRAPHIHCHVFPHFADGDPIRNVDISEGDVVLGPDDTAARTKLLRRALAAENPEPAG